MGSLNDQSLPPAAPQAIFSDEEFQPLNPDEFRKQAHRVVDFIADYYSNVDSYPVLSQVQPGYLRNKVPATPPDGPEELEAILGDVEEVIIPGMTHWASPNFFAYFPATISTAGFLGEMLCTSFNAVGFNWLASPAATELETVVMDWLAKLLRLPDSFLFSSGDGGGGVIQGTTTESILCAVVAARDAAITRGSPGLDIGKLVVYGSDQTHSAYAKACRIAGIFSCNVRSLKTSVKENNLALSPERLREAMAADAAAGLVPLFVCATVGTTSTTAVDPVGELADVAKEYGAWVHVDAAYAGSACICPEFRHHLDGVEKVDSISMSPHKWLLSHLDCCCLWVQNASSFTQGLVTDPEYLRNKASEGGEVVEYKDWQVGVGRRFRALRLWMVLRRYGAAHLRAHIRSDVEMACMFEGLVREDGRFQVVVPRRFGLVCFRLVGDECTNRRLLEEVNSTGKMYATHTVVEGVYVLRFAVGASLTTAMQVLAAWRLIQEKADFLVGKKDASWPIHNMAMGD